MTPAPLLNIYHMLLDHYGPQGWWPAETRFEMMVGAILTQRTSWSNVERAIGNLKGAGLMSIGKMARASLEEVRREVRASGFYDQKARRVLNLAKYLDSNYRNLDELFGKEIVDLRKELLDLKGIGKETADSIILYGAHKPVFVVDAYTKRLCGRMPIPVRSLGYDDIQSHFQVSIPKEAELFKEFHALIVVHGKERCKVKPSCPGCPLSVACRFPKRENEAKD